jgi:hypothetical protein
VGGAAALLPLLECDLARAGTRPPRRMLIVQTTNGVTTAGQLGDKFWPSNTSEKDFALDTDMLSPLAPHKPDILLLGGIEMTVALRETVKLGGSIGHRNLPHLLTGRAAVQGRNSVGAEDAVANGISIDQYVARAIARRDGVPLRSLNLGVLTSLEHIADDNQGYISFNGPAVGSKPARPQGNAPEENPARVYDALFTAGAAGAAPSALDAQALTRLRRARKSALDFVARDLDRLRQVLGHDDRRRVDAHAEAIREIEQQLDGRPRPDANAGCRAPQLGPSLDHRANENMPQIMKLQLDLVVAAMACDLTRVATLMACNAGNYRLRMPWINPAAKGDHHGYSHSRLHAEKIRAERWFFGQMAYVIERMKLISEAGGTMLDNSVVWWANNMSDGDRHECRGMPWVLAGRCGGAFQTGRYLRFGDWASASATAGTHFVPHNGLLIALANAMEVPTRTFGDPEYGGELPGLRG